MNKLFSFLINIPLFLFIFISSLYLPTDLDLGWELKYGEYFFKHHQILQANISSQVMPGYNWTNPHIGSDILTYFIFNHFGFFGLTIAGALAITFTFFFIIKASRFSLASKILLIPLFVYLEYPLNKYSLKPEVLSMLLLSILLYLLNEYEKNYTKKIYLVIPLFMIWANLHGEFILGLGIFLLWIITQTIRSVISKNEISHTRNNLLLLLILLILASLSAILNPFGLGIYTEAIKHFNNSVLQFIVEWTPYLAFSQGWLYLVGIGFLVFLSIFFKPAAKSYKEYFLFLVVPGVVFILALTSRRYVWPFFYLSLPVLNTIFNKVKLEKIRFGNVFFFVIFSTATMIVFFMKLPSSQYSTMSWNTYCNRNFCSPKAAQFILDHKLNQAPGLLTTYNLGGWLIWNYPEIKPTIDGRMTVWKTNNGESPFEEYIMIVRNIVDIDQTGFRIVFIQLNDSPLIARLEELSRMGKWRLIYYDHNTAIFQKAS